MQIRPSPSMRKYMLVVRSSQRIFKLFIGSSNIVDMPKRLLV